MPYFAKCEPTTEPSKFKVVDNIRAEQEFVDNLPGFWVRNDYNSYGNVHYAPSPPAEPHTPDGLPAFRANYAGLNFTYDDSVVIDGVVGVFYPPQPAYPGTWVLNTSTWLWENTDPVPPTEV